MTRRRLPLPLLACVVLCAGGGCGGMAPLTAREPERLAPPAPSRPWLPPDDVAPPPFAAEVSPDPERVYDLPGLIDLALQANPATRISWQRARAAAARAGVAGGAYYPVLAVVAGGGYSRVEDRTSDGPVFTRGPSLTPRLVLGWTLLDFGRREADFDEAMQLLRQSNLSLNRELQRLAFEVQEAFYSFDASRAQVKAAEATLASARAVVQAADARQQRGLATQTEVLLARQEQARAAFQVQVAHRGVADTQARLAATLGISPAAPLQVAELSSLPLPAELRESVEQAMDRALTVRPDLAARLAELRAREAEVRRAQASFLPDIKLTGEVGGTGGQFEAQGASTRFDYVEPVYGAFLQLSWTLFDGFARENTLRLAEARRGEAAAQLSRDQLRALQHVWKSYADVKVALIQYDYAVALLEASEDAYQAASEGYGAGLANILDLLAAERDLAGARSTIIDTRAELLRTAAALAFAVGDSEEMLVGMRPPA